MANLISNPDSDNNQKGRNYIQIGRLYGLGGRSVEFTKANQELDEHQKKQYAFIQQHRIELENNLKLIEQRLTEHQKFIISQANSTWNELDEMLNKTATALSVLQVSEWTPDNLRIIVEGIQRNFVDKSTQLTSIVTEMLNQAANLVINFDYNGQSAVQKEKIEAYIDLLIQLERHRQELLKGYREGDAIKNAFKKPGA